MTTMEEIIQTEAQIEQVLNKSNKRKEKDHE